MNILFLTKYSRKGASSRYRTYQYLPYLASAGIDFEVRPLFSDAYLEAKYANDFRWLALLLLAYIRRFLDLLTARRFDLIVIEYEALPYLPAWLEHVFYKGIVPYIVDYDDAIFHQYDQHRFFVIRTLLGGKIGKLMSAASKVIVGNDYLAAYAKKSKAGSVVVIPTVVDLSRYQLSKPIDNKEYFTIGWIGSPSTAKYLSHIESALKIVASRHSIKLRLVGAGSPVFTGLNSELIEWSELTEVAEICCFDVGIMPLPDEPWARGKCGFKLIQYMACGIPVVASPVGVNRSLVSHGENGFLATTEAEWVLALETLLRSKDSLVDIGLCGRKRVEDFYSLDKVHEMWIKCLQSVISIAN